MEIANNSTVLVLLLSQTYNIYYHLPSDKNWDLKSCKLITSVSTVNELIGLNENMNENVIKYCMLFVMKSGIAPLQEDARNKNGGYFSYKVYNKTVVNVWKDFVYLFCGGTLMKNNEDMACVNGITISPKKNFCILKIWLETLKIQNPDAVSSIENVSNTGVLFTPHF